MQLAEFSNWAAGIRDAVQQSLQPFSVSAAFVVAHDCATGLWRRRSHAAYLTPFRRAVNVRRHYWCPVGFHNDVNGRRSETAKALPSRAVKEIAQLRGYPDLVTCW